MQPNFTPKSLRSLFLKIFATAFISVSFLNASNSQVIFSENFNVVAPFPTGWDSLNHSVPLGPLGWLQGDPGLPAQSGGLGAFIASNYQSTSGVGTISNWLFTPTVTLKNGDVFTFYTFAYDGTFPDRLQVRLSTNGASTDVGTTATSVGDFSALLLDINPTYSTTAYPEVWTQYTIVISGVPSPVSGRLAFRYFVENGGPSGSNSNYIGIDDAVYTSLSCTGTPTPGNTISSSPAVCPGINFTLSLQTPGSGVTYQWQSSPDNVSWSDISGATSATLVRNQTAETYYRCNVTCSGNTGTSTALLVTMNTPSACYCTPPSSTCSLDDEILNVTFGTLNNSSSGCSGVGYSDYTSIAAPNVYVGAQNPISVTIGPGGNDRIAAWIDYNKNGQFEASEFTLIGTTPSGTVNGTINVPASATLGVTRMRIRVRYSTAINATDACTGFSFGETEDYNVNLVPCIPVVISSSPTSKSISCSSNTSFTVAATGTLPSFQWEVRPNASSAWQFVTDGGIYSGATTATLTLTNVSQANNGYQYRALVTGGCSAPDFTSVATLTVTPLIATVSPTSATICSGTIQQLNLTNASSPTTVSFSNSTLLPVPDATPAGVYSTIAVSGIPAGAIISNISVKFNMTHTYVGDLEINLIAPNGTSMNLVGELDGGTGSNSSDNFVNTVVSSTSTTPMSGAPAPRTGTFAADRLQGYGPSGNYQTSPNGMPWSALQSIMNGNWQLGLSDWYTGDVGTLSDWTISITYGAPATGVWTSSPTTPNTMFTDALATVPYIAGSLATTIYVKPAATTSYSVVYSTSTPCTSNPTVIPVNVVTAVTGIVDPTNKSVCVGGSTSFTSSASGGPFARQWQVSTDGGVTWSDVSGATSATLSLGGVTQTMNNNRYRCNYSNAPCTGITSSGSAILTVNALPTATISAPDVALAPTQTTTITATSTPAAVAGGWTWTLNGAALSGTSNTQSVNVDGQGTYQASVTDINGCISTSNELVIGAEASDKLWIYPNPTSGSFQVRLYFSSDVSDKRKVSIYNMAGQVVEVREFTLVNTTPPYMQMDFDLSHLGHGTYLVKVAQVYSGKIVSGLVVVE